MLPYNDDFSSVRMDALSRLDSAVSLSDIESLAVDMFGKNGHITKFLAYIKEVPVDQKKKYGANVNELKSELLLKIDTKKKEINAKFINDSIGKEKIDLTIPCSEMKVGKLHPINKVIEEVEEIFHSMGFGFGSGPEIEDVYYNFTAANIPEHHPARQMHDTFYIKGHEEKILRTHTTPIQIREMLKRGAPLRIIAPGRTYRSDYDATHTPVFHQIEGLVIESGITFSHLVSCVTEFQRRFFNLSDLKLRIRPSYFPFTEPSAEIDIPYDIKNNKIVIGLENKFLEIMGCGMVHPQVLINGGIDPEKYTGFAFGFGVERLASLKYGIPDLRGYFEIDKNWKDTFGMDPFV